MKDFKRFGYIHPETPNTRTYLHTPTMWLFSVQTNGRQSCAVATTDLCNDMKINTCGETAADDARRALLHRCSREK